MAKWIDGQMVCQNTEGDVCDNHGADWADPVPATGGTVSYLPYTNNYNACPHCGRGYRDYPVYPQPYYYPWNRPYPIWVTNTAGDTSQLPAGWQMSTAA